MMSYLPSTNSAGVSSSKTPGMDEDHPGASVDIGSPPGKRKREQAASELEDQVRFNDVSNFHSSPLDSRSSGAVLGPTPKRRKSQAFVPGQPPRETEMVYGLTVPIWRTILGFVPPVFLGRMLRVSRRFRNLLDPVGSDVSGQVSNNSEAVESESTWVASRRRFAPGLPKNLPGKRDLDMWRLIRGNQCQICHVKKPLCTSGASTDQLQAGPGNLGVRVIWAFGLRCCGSCLDSSSEQV